LTAVYWNINTHSLFWFYEFFKSYDPCILVFISYWFSEADYTDSKILLEFKNRYNSVAMIADNEIHLTSMCNW